VNITLSEKLSGVKGSDWQQKLIFVLAIAMRTSNGSANASPAQSRAYQVAENDGPQAGLGSLHE
jgi:hypothetical protein